MTAVNQITYIGHATLLLEIDGMRILTDPLLRDNLFHLQRRGGSVDAALYQNLDAVLISHPHWDHFDLSSLRLLEKNIHLIVPSGSAQLLNRNGFRNTLEMLPGKTTRVGELTIQATYAKHNNRLLGFRLPGGCLGFIIRGSSNIYFPGDTDLFPGMSDLGGDLDLALLPVWGWGPNIGPDHMDPHRAALALTLLRPRVAIPIHWGTFYPRGVGWLRPGLMTEPPQLFKREAEKIMPQVEVKILAPGTSFRF